MPKPSLCLNMIVKNEAARIERCLVSLEPYIKTFSILDTGSTDDTVAKIMEWARYSGVTGLVHTGEFHNFSQARNEAFQLARVWNGIVPDQPFCQFALLADADMQLVVDDPLAFDKLDENALSYDMMQRAGAISYANRRIVNLSWGQNPYVGVTHEYIDVPAAGMIEGAAFLDYADGANRTDKYPRDAALLEEALKTDPENGRSWYYLGNTYRDWGKPADAIWAYQQRIKLGGWDEETHSAMMNVAFCYKDIGDDSAFVARMIDAYSFRPRRAEPLYDLAKYYREKGSTGASLLFAAAGMGATRPNDLLFVNDFVYQHGLKYEYSISGYYNEAHRDRAFEVTDRLSLDPACPPEYRNSARRNLFHFTRPLSAYCPSFKPVQLDFTPPAGYVAMNPSVVNFNGRLKCNVRCVNYTMDEHGRYLIKGTNGEANGTNPIDTRNFVVSLGYDLSVDWPSEIMWHRPLAAFNLVTGLEDVRLWQYEGNLWFNACVREQSLLGTCQQAIGKIAFDVDPCFVQVRDFEILSGDDQHEKNWMHLEGKRFIYRLDTIIDPYGVQKLSTGICPDNISGSSQLIEFKGGKIAVVHEASEAPDTGKRTYWHRFALFDAYGGFRYLSAPFVFFERQIEFCAGLAKHPNGIDLVVSFGVRDAEAWVATVPIEEVAMMFGPRYER